MTERGKIRPAGPWYSKRLMDDLVSVSGQLEWAIARIPTSPLRDQITDANILVLSAAAVVGKLIAGEDLKTAYKGLVKELE